MKGKCSRSFQLHDWNVTCDKLEDKFQCWRETRYMLPVPYISLFIFLLFYTSMLFVISGFWIFCFLLDIFYDFYVLWYMVNIILYHENLVSVLPKSCRHKSIAHQCWRISRLSLDRSSTKLSNISQISTKIWSPENWYYIFLEQNIIFIFIFPLPIGLLLESETV